MRFEIKQTNLASIKGLAALVKAVGARSLELEISDTVGEQPRFDELIHLILPLLDFEADFEVWLKNFPYCVVPEIAHDHIWVDRNGEKIAACDGCLYQKICAGFPVGYLEKFGEKEICLVPDRPQEVMFEIESSCNFGCQFCFNKLSFARDGRNWTRLEISEAKKIIDGIAAAGINTLRFTGGEPLLYPDLRELITYARSLKLSVWLNTNASLINETNAVWLGDLVENILIPIESHLPEREAEITRFPKSLEKKIAAVRLLKNAGIKTLRVGTVALPENIKNFSELKKIILSLPVDEWEFYNPVGAGLSREEATELAEQILQTRQETNLLVTIANSIPFCLVDDPQKLNLVSHGALFDDGHNRLVIDPRGFVKPHYFVEENIGKPEDIMAAWQHPQMKARRNLENLPEKCASCRFKFKCRGGSGKP